MYCSLFQVCQCRQPLLGTSSNHGFLLPPMLSACGARRGGVAEQAMACTRHDLSLARRECDLLTRSPPPAMDVLAGERRARLQPAIPAGSPDVPPRRRRHSVGEAAHRRARLGGGGGRRRRQAQAGVDVRGAGGDGVGGVRPVQGARRRGRHVPDLPRRPPRAARPRRRRGVPRELREDVPGALPRRGGAPRRARAAARGAGGAGGGGGDGGGAARRDGGRVGDRAGDADPLLPHGERGGEPAVWGVRRRRLRVREAGARRARVDEPRRRDGARRRPARRRGAALGVHRPGARGRLQGAGPWLADATQCHRSNICHLALSIN